MSVLPRTLLWTRLDTAGAEQVSFDDRRGLIARGYQLAVDPVAYGCRYELITDEKWVTTRFEATAEGAGWSRSVRMERGARGWRVTTSERGDLDAAVRAAGLRHEEPLPGIEDPDRLHDAYDVDLGGSPLTTTLPLRRLGPADTTITAAWVLPPSLAVVASQQTYTVLGADRVRYSSDGFSADIELDPERFVIRYAGLAERAGAG